MKVVGGDHATARLRCVDRWPVTADSSVPGAVAVGCFVAPRFRIDRLRDAAGFAHSARAVSGVPERALYAVNCMPLLGWPRYL